MKKNLMTLAAVLCCIMAMMLTTSCTSDNNDNPVNESFLPFDPLLNWGCSIADVEQHIMSKNWWEDGNDRLEFWEDPFESWHKWYWVSDNGITEQYLFETEDGQNLRFVLSICWDNTVPGILFEKTLQHQGFQKTGETIELFEDPFERYLSADGQTEAFTNADEEGYWTILYRPNTTE